MKNLGGPSRIPRQNRLRSLLKSEFQEAQLAYDLFAEFLSHAAYDHDFCLRLLDLAQQLAVTSWEIRRLATLMAEHQILRLRSDNLEVFDALFTRLNLKAAGPDKRIASAVLREGYSTSEFRDFIPEFQRRLARLSRVHQKIRGPRTSDAAWREFIELSRLDCKLSLTRYLFSPEDVADKILSEMQITDGVKDLDISETAFIQDEIAHAINRLPEFETKILRRLCGASNTYWVAETTSSKINSLVEYPLTTVVLVVKPPGSHFEFEIKRAGRKGINPLSVVFSRNGSAVPPSHRLDGSSMQWLLRYESHNASKLRAIYRMVHGTEAEIPGYITRTTIYSVPTGTGTVQTSRYFTEPRIFGERFQGMRAAMAAGVNALQAEEGENLPPLPGDQALTAEFLSHVAPAQAILTETTSFRLDKVASYLSSGGAEHYFKTSLGIDYDGRDAMRFADELLEEVLGTYQPPAVRYTTYGRYVEAAFSVAGNPANENRIFLSLVRQIAKFWGTLLGARGYTRGESFVARNVGLKSYWNQGAWKVKMIFMDHDGLSLPELGNGHFFAQTALPSMVHDERHIWGRQNPDLFPVSEIGYLQNIYRIGHRLEAEGQSLAIAGLRNAYKKTQQELLVNPKMRAFFSKEFLSRLLDWDTLAGGYLQMSNNPQAMARWRKKMTSILSAKGYERDAFDYYLKAFKNSREFLERNSFLFDDDPQAS